MANNGVVIVESPAKAKTINKYLGGGYTVLASYGHVRDLPPKDGSVDTEQDFQMIWQNSDKGKKAINDIVSAVKKSDKLFLATDPDREGEAISWHILEILKEKKLLDATDVKRVTFNQITKSAIQDAFANPRQLDTDLIDAYLARRALDYLVGFNLSPILWRKLPGSRSAGRVQSVALRLICEREFEREIFKEKEYWSIDAGLLTKENKGFGAKLSVLNNEKLKKFSISEEKEALDAIKTLKSADLSILNIEKKQVRRNPQPPFITSTLQQEASRKLGFNATKTMRTAQQLYEGADIGGETIGLITYMRTDGITLSPEAVNDCIKLVKEDFGGQYVPDNQRVYKSKAKNAQEAHEAIRPTGVQRRPDRLRKYLNDDQFALYELIWKRTVASCMKSAILDKVAVDIGDKDKGVVCRANGSVIAFDGFLTLYRESTDDSNDRSDEREEKILPPIAEGDKIILDKATPNQHFTQPPPRYTEASLVKRMEELGIGRPSTYASILQVLRDRNYVQLEKRQFIPEDRGRIVTTFLEHFFPTYIQYDFTAQLEEELDDISAGKIEWKNVLRNFWDAFSKTIDETKELTITNVIDALDDDLGPHFFPDKESRTCPSCADGRLGLKLGKFGAFIGCSNYPECKHTKPLAIPTDGEDGAEQLNEPKTLGDHPATGLSVSLRKGPYGPYVQMEAPAIEDLPEEEPELTKAGKPKKKKKPKPPKPKRTSIPKGTDLSTIDLDKAVSLLSLPRDVGQHPETGKKITAGIGCFGPYVKHETTYKSIPADDDVLTIGLNRAVDLLATASKRASSVLKELGTLDKKKISIHNGRYGPYVKHGKVMASLPKDVEPEDVTLEQAKELLEAKANKAKAKKEKPAAKKKATKKKTTKKKASTKKAKEK